MSLHADLTSVMSSLEQLLERLDEAAGSLEGNDKDSLLGDIYEVERHLRAAKRRLIKAVDSTAS